MNDVVRTSKEITAEVWEGIRARHSLVENSSQPIKAAQKMGYLSHLDRANLLAEIERLRGSHETGNVAPETLVIWVGADYWRCRCKCPGDINHGSSYQCRDCGTVRPEKAPAQKASE